MGGRVSPTWEGLSFPSRRDLVVPLVIVAVGAVLALAKLNGADVVSWRTALVLSLLIVLFLLAGATLALHFIQDDRPERAFLAVFALMAVLALAAFPPFSNPDGIRHYYRAFQISQGEMVANRESGSDLPATLPGNLIPGADDFDYANLKDRQVVANLAGQIDTENTEEYGTTTMALYSPVAFLPSVVGIMLARLVTTNAWAIIFVSRLFNLLAVGGLLFYAIWRLPVGKNLAAAVALVPMAIELYNSNSPDGFAIALPMALLAVVLHLRLDTGERVSPQALVGLFAMGSAIALGKIVYAPFVALTLLIPHERFGSRRNWVLGMVLLVVIPVLENLAWLTVASGLVVAYPEGVDSARQVAFVLSSPLAFLAVCVRTMVTYSASWLQEEVGSNLGMLNIAVDSIYVIALWALIALLWFFSPDLDDLDLGRGERALMICIPLLVVLLSFASLYVQWTSVGASLIAGFQGRYLLPVLFPLLVAVRPRGLLASHDSAIIPCAWTALFSVDTCVLVCALVHAL